MCIDRYVFAGVLIEWLQAVESVNTSQTELGVRLSASFKITKYMKEVEVMEIGAILITNVIIWAVVSILL